MIGPKTAISLSAWPGDIFVTAAFSWVFADIMAADLILRAWAVFMLGIVLSEQLPEGSGPISGDTGGYHPGSDDWVSTLGDIADSSKHDSKQQQSFSLEPLETWENPMTLGTSSDYVGQKEQSSQQPVQFTQTHHGVQMPEPSKRNYALGAEDSRVVSPYVIATAIGTTSGYLNQNEPKHHTPAPNSSSYHFVMNGQHANGSIGSTSGAESRQPSDEQILPSRAEALNLLKQALKDLGVLEGLCKQAAHINTKQGLPIPSWPLMIKMCLLQDLINK
ncbi:hypothetical protein AALO_G00214600 [Alosa alosa]|uniref:Uncharacterized protein n=1 Tax=Alosa alosa TaxID=278164 RepID=A0AAV6G4X2_9TELE|nr:hypothetical protein AALO_G00214600 [Alosa alosa]